VKVDVPRLDVPQPLLPKAIEPKTKSDQEKLLSSLHKIQTEDPSFIVFYDREMKQTVYRSSRRNAVERNIRKNYMIAITLK